MPSVWLLRMARWARRPPSARQVKLVAGIVLACLALYAVERFVGFPDWLAPNDVPKGRISGP